MCFVMHTTEIYVQSGWISSVLTFLSSHHPFLWLFLLNKNPATGLWYVKYRHTDRCTGYADKWFVKISQRHTDTHTPQSRPTQGVCTVPGRGAISSNGRKLVSVICCHGGLHWHCQTPHRSRRDTDREAGREEEMGQSESPLANGLRGHLCYTSVGLQVQLQSRLEEIVKCCRVCW